MESKVKLSPPWMKFYREIVALFAFDPDIKTLFDEEASIIKVYVQDVEKQKALAKLLPPIKKFGNVEIRIEVVPRNTNLGDVEILQKAFKGNPALSSIKSVTLPDGQKFSYVIFVNRVVQFFNDDLGDINGLESTLYEDIARHVLEIDEGGVFFCTAMPEE